MGIVERVAFLPSCLWVFTDRPTDPPTHPHTHPRARALARFHPPTHPHTHIHTAQHVLRPRDVEQVDDQARRGAEDLPADEVGDEAIGDLAPAARDEHALHDRAAPGGAREGGHGVFVCVCPRVVSLRLGFVGGWMGEGGKGGCQREGFEDRSRPVTRSRPTTTTGPANRKTPKGRQQPRCQ